MYPIEGPLQTMHLSSLFLELACLETRAALTAGPELEACLQQLLTASQRAYPTLGLGPADFVPFVARHLSTDADSLEALSSVHIEELYLVCAYGMGNQRAFDELEANYLTTVKAALLRLRITMPEIEDLLSELRRRLVEMQDPKNPRRGYSGRGSLKGWLVLCAIREAEARKHSTRREQSIEQSWPEIPGLVTNPDTQVLIHKYKEEFQSAFRDAVAQLTPRERNLLRYTYLDRLSCDQISRLYRIHRATAARWVGQAQEQLADRVRDLFLVRVGLHAESLAQIVAEIQSQLSLSLGALLTPAVEVELHVDR